MLVRDLLEAAELRLRLLWGGEAELARPVSGACTSDLLRPGRYVEAGQVLLTGLVWHGAPADSEVFVADAAAAGASAVAAGEGLLGAVPQDVAEAAARHGLALLAVPADVPFHRVQAHVDGGAQSERVRRLTADLARQRRLLEELAEGRSLEDLALATSRRLRLRVRVLTATGRAVVAGVPPLPAETVDDVVRAAGAAAALPAVVRLPSGTWSVLGVGPRGAHRAQSWFLVVDGDLGGWEPATAEAVRELAGAAALQRSREHGEARAARVLADEAVRAAEDGSGRTALAGCLQRAGLDPRAGLVVATADAPGAPRDLARELLADAVAQLGPPVVGAAADGGAVALVPAAEAREVSALLHRALARAGAALPGARLVAGVGAAAGAEDLGDALRSAVHALRLARESGEAVSVVLADELASAVRLLRAVPEHLRRAFAADVLGPLLDASPAHAELLATLREFVACSGAWARAAQRLHVHQNTVRYRIARVEGLLGRDVRDLDDLVDLRIALDVLDAGHVSTPHASARPATPRTGAPPRR
ncbi:helix-turn-helix domain-containing protein [Kineococcus gypseus]|uniref:helix-turn-helix domain-containing protein n=1 Tax=Kineococcus gypseus TaxID=1637102 RepID=UPI003D7DFF4F